MRKLFLGILLATTAVTPALAQRGQQDDRSAQRAERRSERAQQSNDRSQVREQRADRRADVRERNSAGRDRQSAEVQQRQLQVQQAVRERAADNFQARANFQGRANINARGRPTLDPTFEQRSANRSLVQQRQEQRGDMYRQRSDMYRQQIERSASRGANRNQQIASRRDRRSDWRTDWRDDRRYDWRNYRNSHRSIFRVGAYYDPFGYGYRRFDIGWQLAPNYYSNNYWLSDPYMYRLPYAPYPYQWVRYYNDAMLVDTMSGQVVDVMYDFFW